MRKQANNKCCYERCKDKRVLKDVKSFGDKMECVCVRQSAESDVIRDSVGVQGGRTV